MAGESQSTKKRKVGDAVVEALVEARAELDDREAKLEEREEALRKAIDGVEYEKKLMVGRKLSDVLPLNIGGTRCHVLRKTLCQHESSMLAAHFSGRWDESIEKDSDGFFFIDQSYELFIPLINLLRAKAIENPSAPVAPPGDMQNSSAFLRIVEYYGMTQFVYQQHFELHRGQHRAGEIRSGFEPGVDCAAWSTFCLKSTRHSRIVKSFEIVFSSVERPQIGWARRGSYRGFASQIDVSDHKGAGEDESSIALDRDRGGIFHNGNRRVSLPELAIRAGAVVICEKTSELFCWRIDGVEVASIPRDESLSNTYDLVPVISAKGQWTLTHFAYELP